jgi:hypothetical protein
MSQNEIQTENLNQGMIVEPVSLDLEKEMELKKSKLRPLDDGDDISPDCHSKKKKVSAKKSPSEKSPCNISVKDIKDSDKENCSINNPETIECINAESAEEIKTTTDKSAFKSASKPRGRPPKSKSNSKNNLRSKSKSKSKTRGETIEEENNTSYNLRPRKNVDYSKAIQDDKMNSGGDSPKSDGKSDASFKPIEEDEHMCPDSNAKEDGEGKSSAMLVDVDLPKEEDININGGDEPKEGDDDKSSESSQEEKEPVDENALKDELKELQGNFF